ncbi:MAG: glycosyl transferase [Acidobacteriia bacterium]|nr:glycosyl transferase [Terriglobia bacterium]
MGLHTETEGIIGDEERKFLSARKEEEVLPVRNAATELAASLTWLPDRDSSETFSTRCEALLRQFTSLSDRVDEGFEGASDLEDVIVLRGTIRMLLGGARTVFGDLSNATLPVVSNKSDILPRVLVIAQAFLDQMEAKFSKSEFTAFCMAFEESAPLQFHEIGSLVPALKMILLERIAEGGLALEASLKSGTALPSSIAPYIRAFEHVLQASWKEDLESLIPFDEMLRRDPAGAYAAMDFESRNWYRERVAQIARRSDQIEMEVAEAALTLAKEAQKRGARDPRIAQRESHIGYYLVGDGDDLLCQRVGYHRTFGEAVRHWLRAHPDEFLLVGIAVFTFVVVTGVLWLLTPPETPLPTLLLSMLILLLPSSQAAVQLMNYLTTNLLAPTTLPKLDVSQGVPDHCATLVAIPTLLLSEAQVHHLVEELEVRYLGNHDCNIHFAIVSDLPDSPEPTPEDNELVALCSSLITDLNDRYAHKNSGTFFHLHRHRVYNPREKGWMGWERKRGKLLDLNQLLRGRFDSFPVKIGDLSILPTIRFVITLDSDTELPRGSAHRMIGALAHPLNQAIVNPEKNIVVAGYGILQPRVDISVQCTTQSRLAAIFAGETGLDPYTRAISDVYQDLYGEGSFTGKGIYEVDTMIRVLYGRFPRNSLLSHDLIEGAYARAGLTSDIAVIEDYPSHYSAYSRRKHRWLRGDWQIVEWLTDTVPDESGAAVPNPISLVSRWKIFDNLRRSLVEPATCTLLLYSWFVMNRPVLWTFAAICILFVPAWVELLFGLARAVIARSPRIARDAFGNLFTSNFTVLLTLTLLAHQTLLSLDAVARALVRRLVTRERLLEWETAAEAELGNKRTAIDRYIDWMPFLAAALGLALWFTRPHALLAASPILILWACSKPLAVWLNASPVEAPPEISRQDEWLLRKSALHIWRYFAELSNEEQNWLVPDNVQDDPPKLATSISPTNVGLLLNARQVANELGYITVPEMVNLTQKTLSTVERMRKYRGHLLNWYDTRTLDAKPPFFVSSVDSGNLVASLWTLRQGCRDCLRRPLLSEAHAAGLRDHLRVLVKLRAFGKRELGRFEDQLRGRRWLTALLNFPEEKIDEKKSKADETAVDVAWFRKQAHTRVQAARELSRAYMPWTLPEFSELIREILGGRTVNNVPLERFPDLISEFELRLDDVMKDSTNEADSLRERFLEMLSEARQNTLQLIDRLKQISQQAYELAEAMDFSFMVDKQRLLVSVGFDAERKELQPYYYDLLATEPRTAVFVGIAKDDVPQDCWFRLRRPVTTDHGRPVVLSWTGTMFEYLMPSIWMRSYRNTLLHRATVAAVRSQQEYAALKGVPWGISESACARRNEVGDYHYEAFGVPSLALKKHETDPLIISPYSTFLALNVDRKGAMKNLHRMDSLGWFGKYGFYESADYTVPQRLFGGRRCELVHSWMVHHQGMSLLSLANFLCDNIVQRWFHSDRRVQASELLLQEKPVSQAV